MRTCCHFSDDHNRVLLKETASATGTDYINASYIVSLFSVNPQCGSSFDFGSLNIYSYVNEEMH